MGNSIGVLDLQSVAAAICHVAALRGMRAEDMLVMSDQQWAELAYKVLGLDTGMVRLRVIRHMVEWSSNG